MRSLQMADVVNSMTDLMHMSQHESSMNLPIAALQHFHMTMANRQDQSLESLHSMPTVTSLGLQTSPDEPQRQQQQQQQPELRQQAQTQQQQQPVHPASQQPSRQLDGFRATHQSGGPVQGKSHSGPAAHAGQALASPRHSNPSGASAFAQQTHSSGRPPTPRGARR